MSVSPYIKALSTFATKAQELGVPAVQRAVQAVTDYVLANKTTAGAALFFSAAAVAYFRTRQTQVLDANCQPNTAAKIEQALNAAPVAPVAAQSVSDAESETGIQNKYSTTPTFKKPDFNNVSRTIQGLDVFPPVTRKPVAVSKTTITTPTPQQLRDRRRITESLDLATSCSLLPTPRKPVEVSKTPLQVIQASDKQINAAIRTLKANNRRPLPLGTDQSHKADLARFDSEAPINSVLQARTATAKVVRAQKNKAALTSFKKLCETDSSFFKDLKEGIVARIHSVWESVKKGFVAARAWISQKFSATAPTTAPVDGQNVDTSLNPARAPISAIAPVATASVPSEPLTQAQAVAALIKVEDDNRPLSQIDPSFAQFGSK
ncbi:MAG: hypothetical protein HY050_08110 [Actinobacteria bacterium]|nr:hypothetical protein [Actinomycetota bacterium]